MSCFTHCLFVELLNDIPNISAVKPQLFPSTFNLSISIPMNTGVCVTLCASDLLLLSDTVNPCCQWFG